MKRNFFRPEFELVVNKHDEIQQVCGFGKFKCVVNKKAPLMENRYLGHIVSNIQKNSMCIFAYQVVVVVDEGR